MKAHLYRVECLTNMHVGSGETTYRVVDNEVERDPVLENVPIIHASGVKGALRDHCESAGLSKDVMLYIFGQEVYTKAESKETKRGEYKFFAANLIARPLRISKGDRSYLLTTTQEILESYRTLLKGVGISVLDTAVMPTATPTIQTNMTAIAVEGADTTKIPGDSVLQRLIALEYGVAQSFKDYALPVIARNQLENGMSKNLWYEEIVPYKSIFLFVVLIPENAKYFDEFNKAITAEGTAVQFGGNASVGYGYTSVTKVV